MQVRASKLAGRNGKVLLLVKKKNDSRKLPKTFGKFS